VSPAKLETHGVPSVGLPAVRGAAEPPHQYLSTATEHRALDAGEPHRRRRGLDRGAIATSLGDAVRLRSPVCKIAQDFDHVFVEAGELVVGARAVIVAVLPALILDIGFDPPLPDERRTFYAHANAGHETKTIVVYDEPFWREDDLSGQTAAAGSASELTLDASPKSGRPGVLASFTFAHVSERMDALDAATRRKAVLEALAERFGARAASPRDFVETAWWTEAWTRGCTMAHYAPGVLTKSGHLLREPFGRIHLAGTETATVSHGTMDGAVRSGERAAAEILDRS
jgi:monoamine oxidase